MHQQNKPKFLNFYLKNPKLKKNAFSLTFTPKAVNLRISSIVKTAVKKKLLFLSIKV
jgi:predicted DNA binding CopG/RHH family protein